MDPGTLWIAVEVLALLGLGAALTVVWRLVRRDRAASQAKEEDGDP